MQQNNFPKDLYCEREYGMLTFSVLMISQPVPQKDRLNDLLNRISLGDMAAFESLYRETSVGVYSFALSILKNKEDAEDITHDVYLSIYKSAKLYKRNDNPLSWIMTITKNFCYKKKNKDKRTCEITEVSQVDYSDLISSDNKILLNECLNNLTDEERQIVVLHIVAGFSHKEISAILSIPASTVRSKYARALKKLRTTLKREGAFDE